MSFRLACAPLINEYGTFPNADGSPSGNALLYLGHYYAILERNMELVPEDQERFRGVVHDHYTDRKPGVLSRSPGSPALESWDDYYGVVDAALVVGAIDINVDILTAFQERNWSVSNVPLPTNPFSRIYHLLRCWMARRPGFVAHLKLGAYPKTNKAPNLLDRLSWCLALKQAAKTDMKTEGTDPWLLSWHMVNAYRISGYRSSMMDKAVVEWTKALATQTEGNGMEEAFALYFGEFHPFTLYTARMA